MAIEEKGQSTLWLNPRRLPSLGSVGIHLDTGKQSGNGNTSLLVVFPSIIHLLGAINFALCIRGTRGKGTLRTYPSFRVPTTVLYSIYLLFNNVLYNNYIKGIRKYCTTVMYCTVIYIICTVQYLLINNVAYSIYVTVFT